MQSMRFRLSFCDMNGAIWACSARSVSISTIVQDLTVVSERISASNSFFTLHPLECEQTAAVLAEVSVVVANHRIVAPLREMVNWVTVVASVDVGYPHRTSLGSHIDGLVRSAAFWLQFQEPHHVLPPPAVSVAQIAIKEVVAGLILDQPPGQDMSVLMAGCLPVCFPQNLGYGHVHFDQPRAASISMCTALQVIGDGG